MCEISGEVYATDYFPIYEGRKLMKSYREPFPKISVETVPL